MTFQRPYQRSSRRSNSPPNTYANGYSNGFQHPFQRVFSNPPYPPSVGSARYGLEGLGLFHAKGEKDESDLVALYIQLTGKTELQASTADRFSRSTNKRRPLIRVRSAAKPVTALVTGYGSGFRRHSADTETTAAANSTVTGSFWRRPHDGKSRKGVLGAATEQAAAREALAKRLNGAMFWKGPDHLSKTRGVGGKTGARRIIDLSIQFRGAAENFGRPCCKISGRPFAGLTGLAHAVFWRLSPDLRPSSPKRASDSLSANGGPPNP